MKAEPIDLLALAEEEGPEIILPNRRTVRIRLFDGPHYQLYERLQTVTESSAEADADATKLVRYAVPDITAEEIRSLSPFMAHFIGRAAARQADVMLDLLRKNAPGPATPPGAPAKPSRQPPRSPRKTKSRTPSPGSRKRSAAQTGGP